MRAAQLYIKETNKYIDLGAGGDFPFTLSKSIAEIQDVTKRNKTHSKTFTIPATERNVKALGFPHVIGTDLDAINVYKQQCFVIVNGNVIEDGYVYILKARRDTNAIQFECQFVGGNESWVVALQSLKMSDITVNTSGTSLTISYSDLNVLSRVLADPRTMLDPSYIFVNPYMYQFSDSDANNYDSTETYNGTSRKAKGKDFWVAFRLDYLIDAIFGTATNPLVQLVYGFDAFQLDSDFLTDNATHGFFDNIYYSDRSQDDYPNVTFGGSAANWGAFLPTDVTMLDFFMNVCKTFNLIFSFDGITLKVEPREQWTTWNGTTYDGFYSGNVDWSEKVTTDQEVQYKTSNYKRQVRLSWGADTYPLDENMYPFVYDNTISQPEMRYIVDLDSNNEEGITDIQLPFNTSLSKFYQAKFDRVRTRGFEGPIIEDEQNQATAITFDPANTYSNRLFVFKSGSAPMGMPRHSSVISAVTSRYTGIEAYLNVPTWRQWVYEFSNGLQITQLGYPFMYNCMTVNPYAHTDESLALGDGQSRQSIVTKISDFDTIENVDVADVSVTRQSSDALGLGALTDITSNDIDDVNLGIYNANTVTMVNGLYERFWQETLSKFTTTRTLVTKVLLSRTEFVNLDISKYYTLMGQRFIINKIKDFDPMLDEQLVEVELLAVDAFKASQEVTDSCATISAIAEVTSTQSNIITGTSNSSIHSRGVELMRGRYVYSFYQAANADNQPMLARGITQSGATLTNSASTTTVFVNNADYDPYARGQAGGICRLSDTQCVMIAPAVGVGNVFKVCTYDGGTNNVSIDFTVNDGDTSNYVDREPNFAVINSPSQNVYTIASVGLTRSGAFPYARVWDLNIDDETITSRGILYPMGTSGSGNGQQQLVNLGTVGGKHCFAIFYAKSTSGSGVLYYAVYEYNSSTNTLVEVVGDTLYKSGSNHCTADIPWTIEDGKGILMYLDRVNFDTEITTCIWNGTTLTIGTPSTFGDTNKKGLEHTIRKYYNNCEESATQYLLGVGFWNSGTDTGDFMLFPAVYNPTANTWDVSEFNTANAQIIINDPSNPTSGRSLKAPLIAQADKDNGAVISALRTSANTSFRGVTQNSFTITNT